MSSISDLLRTYLFLIPLIVLVLTEIVKYVVEEVRSGSGHRHLFQQGGMPSSHSAFVMSLLIIVGHKVGTDSVEFAIATVFACIVWYDAIGVRAVLGEQARVLNVLQHFHRLRETLGHSFAEVSAGIAFGAAVTMIGIAMS
ncbi:MAG: divergent PAP2 family protein [Candidatus Peribacteraceae bacterium]|nr:divergent PAP2 family protein [Candidatus Peribacteraceae bacterium]MDD5742727.1 divergent PAP2 family protein [Candidatus Peribacteraceae bacterium]